MSVCILIQPEIWACDWEKSIIALCFQLVYIFKNSINLIKNRLSQWKIIIN